MSVGVKRVFLGWEGSALDRAAAWILEHRGEDLGDVLVALPGSRAARALREKLAVRAKPSWNPPRILTTGALIDELVETDRPVADRLARTLAWAKALGELPRERLEVLAARPPEKDDLRGALALAETVRALHAELAEQGIGFERLAASDRFAVLAETQARWREVLDGLGLADPHESRFAAIDAGKLGRARDAILVGVADMNRLLRNLVLKLADRATALVIAPESESASFDALGCLRAEAWKDRDLPLPLDRWHVVQGPDAQAERAVEILAGQGGRFAPEETSLGVCDEEVAPYLARRLAEESVLARHAAGTPIEGTRPYRLLAHLAAWLARKTFAAYAELLRHPDLEAALRGSDGPDVPSALDRFHEEHLPAKVDVDDAPTGSAHRSFVRLLGDLAGGPRALVEWPGRVRSFLEATFAGPIDPSEEGQRVLAGALSLVAQALESIERLPRALGDEPVAAADAIELLLATARGGSVVPGPPPPGAIAVEMLGWLELPLDESRALVVTGFQDAQVPGARRDDPFLPDGLKKKLGLPCADDRVARDVYAATVLLGSGKRVEFVVGRRNRQGDPILPSRLLFHVPGDELLARVDRWTTSAPAPRPPAVAREAPYELPRIEDAPLPESMSVTSFADYLGSPYHFYLKHVLRLDSVDDEACEMDARGFGSVAHTVLQAFGDGGARHSTDEKEIARALRDALESVASARFGPRPLPAVRLQLDQFGRRLELFARAQARHAAQGWRIEAVEWKPSGKVALDVGGGEAPMLLTGRIDRIDAREKPGSTQREWAILDYKTASRAVDPEKSHRRSGTWCDLQLPLYTRLAREIAGSPTLGIVTLGRDEVETGFRFAEWDAAAIDDALEAARDVVRRIRRREFDDLGRSYPDDPILLAIAGEGLVAAAGEDGEAERTEGDA
jgi:hypothetical protein